MLPISSLATDQQKMQGTRESTCRPVVRLPPAIHHARSCSNGREETNVLLTSALVTDALSAQAMDKAEYYYISWIIHCQACSAVYNQMRSSRIVTTAVDISWSMSIYSSYYSA